MAAWFTSVPSRCFLTFNEPLIDIGLSPGPGPWLLSFDNLNRPVTRRSLSAPDTIQLSCSAGTPNPAARVTYAPPPDDAVSEATELPALPFSIPLPYP